MKTFKEHILEKLKVTKFSGTGITYQEYYDLLDKYCNTVPEKFLDLGVINNFDDDLLPKYKNDETKIIFIVRVLHSTHIAIRLTTYDYTLNKSFSYDISINDVKDKEVDFMPYEYVEKTVKYMEEHIK